MSYKAKVWWHNFCGKVDKFQDHFQAKPAKMGFLGAIGAVAGVILGTVIASSDQEDLDTWPEISEQRSSWIKENATYTDLSSIVSFPEICDMGADGKWLFAAKGLNGDYTLYYGSNGYYQPAGEDYTEEFPERFNDCLNAVQALDEHQQYFSIDDTRQISQPLRSDNAANDGAYNFRKLADNGSGDFDGTLAEYVFKIGSEEQAFNNLRAAWADALDDFEDGDVYDHSDDKNVQTFSYDYVEPEMSYGTILRAGLWGLVLGLGVGTLTGQRSAGFNTREEKRKQAIAALKRNEVHF